MEKIKRKRKRKGLKGRKHTRRSKSKPRRKTLPVFNERNWRVKEWLLAAGIGRTHLWRLSPELAPHSVTIGTRRLILESPREWAERVRKQQSA
ncbi:MAG: hypothetical protein ACRESI_01220 [Gammaproteobacteria bacterium]